MPAVREAGVQGAERIRGCGMRSALLIAAHGSPMPAANDDLLKIAGEVRAAGRFDLVEVCFLEDNEPSIPTAIALCVDVGAERITVLPYFLHAGRHVVLDLPALLESARVAHPSVEFRLADYLGRSPVIAEIIRARAEASADIA